ncbi:hypothetical protein PAXRUDRAFT_167768 [Paxillus rubicundulus Ve08.2h10]|uniref:HAT C-terminal dimerisation domain-containing protein n=1 Tax=Paxillus rubicundulus Ve08.2h10 TaxID=930991 RepID=A0A0D0C1M3_9AGAM|nr:hypothetical protein PAXRUDRAFT_167768 [Paxillus rubicundulus Ve08.2h10]
MYPHLSWMALDYLSIPATSIDVECLFSCGHLILSHTCSCLSAQLTCALLCLDSWSKLKLIKDKDIAKVSTLPEIEGDDDVELVDGWDCIDQNFI